MLFAVTVQALKQLFQGIVQHPEDEKLRKINLHNERFQSEIAKVPGGLQALSSAGFVFVVEEQDKQFIFLEEPDLAADFDKWTSWFENIKEVLSILSEA
mmetsp:Transcript_4784/g.7160  ORF Transcript_4784/g.7160 Transcript_4784/m.7160 type:complete len:99 (-) Transcript_4784:98-394(-)